MARTVKKPPIDLSHTLAEAARELESFAATGDLQKRNRFGHTLGDTFRQAVLNPVALDAVLHLLSEAAKRDPAYALYYLESLSRHTSPEDCEAKVFPLFDRIATPDNLALFLKADLSRLFSGRTLSLIERRLRDGPNGFSPDRLTRDNAEDFTQITSGLSDNRSESDLAYITRAAGVLKRVLTDPDTTDKQKFRAFKFLSDSRLEPTIEALQPGFIKGPYQDFARKVFSGVLPDTVFINNTPHLFYNYFIMDIADGGLLAAVAQAMYKPARALARAHDPRDEMDLLRDLATHHYPLKSIAAWAMHDYRDLHRRDRNTPIRELPPFIAAQHAFASVFVYGQGLDTNEEKLSLARQRVLDAVEEGYLRYDAGLAADIGAVILNEIGDHKDFYAFAGSLAAHIFMRVAENRMAGRSLTELTEDGPNAPMALIDLVNSYSGLRRSLSFRIMGDLLAAQKPTAATMHGLGWLFGNIAPEQEQAFYDRFAKTCAEKPDIAWSAMKPLCERISSNLLCRSKEDPNEKTMGIMPFVAAFLPQMHRLSPALKSEAAAKLQEWQPVWKHISLPDAERIAIDRFIADLRAPIDRSHPAFKVCLG